LFEYGDVVRLAVAGREARVTVVHERAEAALAALQAAELRTAAGDAPAGRTWPVHPDLEALLPGGVLRGGTLLAVQGSTSLLLALLAGASRAGAWVAFVGAPALGMLAAADAGVELERTVLVPRPGPDAPVVVAALLDGMDAVVVGPQTALLDADRRRLAARARERGTLLVSQTAWRGAHLTLDARGGTWSGADHGAGWLRRRTLNVLRTGRGAAARPVEIEVEVPVGAGQLIPAAAPVELPSVARAEAALQSDLNTDRHLRVVA
jgi:hypothetical protein